MTRVAFERFKKQECIRLKRIKIVPRMKVIEITQIVRIILIQIRSGVIDPEHEQRTY